MPQLESPHAAVNSLQAAMKGFHQINKHIYMKKKKLLPKPRLQRFTPMFSAKGFTVLAFIPRSVINFELIFVYDVRKGSTFMHVDIQLSQHHLLKGC